MERIFLSIFLLSVHLCGSENTSRLDDHEPPIPGVSANQRFLVGMQEIAHDLHCDWSLYAVERSLGVLSDSYRFSSTLARVTFNACTLIPELRQRSEIISVRLSAEELNTLQHHLSIIRHHIVEIAERQGLDLHVPLLLKTAHHEDSSVLVASTMVGAFAHHHKENILFKTFAAAAEACGAGDTAHSLKETNLSEMFHNFERIGPLASYINVSKFKKEDNYRTEDINCSLDKIKPIFQKAKAW